MIFYGLTVPLVVSSPNQLEAQREKGDKDVEKQSSPVQSKCLPKRPKGK